MKTNFKKSEHRLTKFIGSITFVALLVLLSGSTVFAGSAVLQLTTPRHQKVIVELDQRTYFSDCEITLRSLNPGQRRLKVYTEEACGPNGGRGTILFNGFITLENRAKTIASVHNNGGLCIDDVLPLGRTMTTNQFSDRSQSSRNNRYNSYDNTPAVCSSSAYTGNSSTRLQPMSHGEFQQLIHRIKRETWSDDRMEIAKDAVHRKQLSSHQVRDIMGCFSYGAHQLEFAKFAYPFVLDPHRFEIVVDELEWSSHRRELRSFIAQ